MSMEKTANINLEIDLETEKISEIRLAARDENEVCILQDVIKRLNLSIESNEETSKESKEVIAEAS